MRFRIDSDQWSEIYDSLTRNKTRTFLTAFGIFWGVFMLILLMGGGKGLETMLGGVFSGFATNSGFISANRTSEPYKGFEKGRWWSLDVRDLNRVKTVVPELDVVTPSQNEWGKDAVYQDKQMTVTVKGVFPDYDQIEDPKIVKGRSINEVDNLKKRKVCVIGSRIQEEFFSGDEDPCGKYIRVNGVYYQVVGVSGKSGNGISIGGNAQKSVSIPFTTMQQAFNKGNNVDILCFTAKKGYKISDVQEKVASVVKRAHFISPNDKQAVNKFNAEAMFNMVDNLFGGISVLVWMIGLGTLFSGAIGVSNIMIVTVKERTTEIGIRRAIGATPGDVLAQVMSESVVLTLVAGMSGIVFAVFILQALEGFAREEVGDASFQITFATALGAALLLATLGVVAGLAPALRAMKIKPVDAMREE